MEVYGSLSYPQGVWGPGSERLSGIRRLILGDWRRSRRVSVSSSVGQLLYRVNTPIREVTITALHRQTPAWIEPWPVLRSQCPAVYKYIDGACCVPGCAQCFYLHDRL